MSDRNVALYFSKRAVESHFTICATLSVDMILHSDTEKFDFSCSYISSIHAFDTVGGELFVNALKMRDRDGVGGAININISEQSQSPRD